MEIILAFVPILIVLGLTIVLPIVSFLRARKAMWLAEDAQRRVTALEQRLASVTSPPPIVEAPRQVAATPVSAQVSAPLSPPVSTPVSTPVLPPAAPPPVQQEEAPGLEETIGSRWLLYAGIAAIILGASYFVKFAFDNGWISEPLRVAVGVAAGLVLVGVGTRFYRNGLVLYGQVLAGGGIVVLYLSIYAALHFYALIAPATAFAFMVVITAGGAYLADRQRAQPLAALALLGGFATPLLIGGERGSQIVLFTYIAILISGSAVLARRHAWPLIGAAAYLGTCAILFPWFHAQYDPSTWLRTEIYLTLYVVLFGYLLWAVLRTTPRRPDSLLAAAALGTAPVIYHFASLAILNRHRAAWLVYIVLFSVAGLVVSQRARVAWIRLAVLLLAGIPMLMFLAALRQPGWYAAAIAVLLALYGLHLAAQWEATDDKPAGAAASTVEEAIHAQANGLLVAASLYVFLDGRFAAWSAPVIAALAAWNGVLAQAFRQRSPRLRMQFVALAATLTAVAIVIAFDGPAVSVGWAAEGVLLAWLASRERSRLLAFGGVLLIAFGAVQLLQVLQIPAAVGTTTIFNARFLATFVVIALLAWLAWHLRVDPEPEVRGRGRDAAIVLANILAVVLVTSEIFGYFGQRSVDLAATDHPTAVVAAGLATQVTVSVAWALYAVALVAIGIRRQYAPARYFAIVLFAITILKVMSQDIANLDRVYKMMSVLGVGLLLLVASYLYQKMAAAQRADKAPR